jgi:hypothetical protein
LPVTIPAPRQGYPGNYRSIFGAHACLWWKNCLFREAEIARKEATLNAAREQRTLTQDFRDDPPLGILRCTAKRGCDKHGQHRLQVNNKCGAVSMIAGPQSLTGGTIVRPIVNTYPQPSI